MKTRTRIATAVASFAFLASTVVAASSAQPLSRMLHLHPGVSGPTDGRVSLKLYNDSTLFKDVEIGGKTYTLLGHQHLDITAPVGTPVYAVSNVMLHRRGDTVLTVAQEMRGQRIDLK